MVVMASLDANTAVEALLAGIHLERYLDSFQRAGLLLAKDLTYLDHDALVSLGITATGHRKRILRLVSYIQRREAQATNQRAATNLQRGRCQSLTERASSQGGPLLAASTGPCGLEALRNSSAPDLVAMLTSSEAARTVVKPIPKPRTVFNRRRTAPIHFSPVPDLAPAPHRRLSQESICFSVCEGLNSADTPPDADRDEAGQIRRLPFSEMGGSLPPVPPRTHRRVPATSCQSPLPSSSSSSPARPASLPPLSPGRHDNDRTSGSPFSGMEMVSNEIYWGTLPLSAAPGSGRGYCSQPLAPPTPPRPTSDRTPERNSGGDSSNTSSGSVRDDPDSISPYCESVFQRETSPLASERDAGRGGATRAGDSEDHGYLKTTLSEGYSTVGEAPPPLGRLAYDADEDLTISPYASYTSLTERATPIISGWLEKLSPQGGQRSERWLLLRVILSASPCVSSLMRTCLISFLSSSSSSYCPSTGNYVFQKRYVKFDGRNLMYFGNEKDVYPKGVIPLAAIQMARPTKDNKFEIVTSQRIFVFKTDNEVLRRHWVSTLQAYVRDQLVLGGRWFGPGTHCQKHGLLELKGTKSKVYVAINTEQIWLHKSEQCFRTGIGITVIEARGATIRDGKHKGFDLITPYRTFSFTADSEREKRDWMEALQEAIAETLSDYEVAEKIWSNRSNRMCADCRAINPDWASINLCVVICKNCAGQHRGLGTMVSKVQSLKLDTSVWSNEIVQLFIMLGNDRANDFWAAHLSQSDELDCDASPSQRREFIGQKYRDGHYRVAHPAFSSQEQLLKVLCSAVSEHTLLKTVTRIFSEARANHLASTAHGQQTNRDLLVNCRVPDPGVYDEIMKTVVYSGFLFSSNCVSRATLSRRSREDFQKFWCSVDQSLLFYPAERSAEPCMEIGLKDVVCLGVSRPDLLKNNGFVDRFRYTFELYLTSDKLYQFGVETPEDLHAWTSAIGKASTPLSCHCLLTREFERIGRLRYRAMLDPQQWKEAYFVLQKSNLFICPQNDGAAEDIINLKRLQELSVASESQNHEKKDILVLVEKGRTFHLQGVGRTDFTLWYADVQRAAGGKGNSLREQQLSRHDIPIIVDSCIAFITQYGLGHEGIYRKNGAKSRIKLLMEEFRKDARNVKLRIGDHFIEDVTDVLKRFFREIDDPVFMIDLHPLWQEAAKIPSKGARLDRYKEIIRSLPRVNRMTLAALVSHLYRVQKCADLNQMCTKNLSLLFAPSLFQTDGKGQHEVKIMEDLIDNYLYVFDIDEEHQTRIELELSLITSWKDTQLSQAGDLIIEVYLEMKTPDSCVTLKVSPTMCAEELTNQVLYMRNIPAGDKDVWMTFEVIEDGQLERPLHPKEKVLEQALQWCKMADPSSAYLVVKRVPKGDGINILTSYKSDLMKVGVLKCREEPPKLLQGNKFQERSFQIKKNKLLLLKDKKSFKAEKEWPLSSMKVYMGVRRKLKAPTRWAFTVMSHKHQLFLCCTSEADLWDWISSFLKVQNDDPGPPILRRHSSSDIAKQKFGTMPLVPIRGHESNNSMLTANQTLRKLHDRRTLSMFFPMQVQHDSVEERSESPEPLYEEVGDFGLQVLKSLETSFLTSSAAETQEVLQPAKLPADPVCDWAREADAVTGHEDGGCRKSRLQTVCTPAQELLLQELSSAFGKNPEEDEMEEEEEDVGP
ncbi:arf-GAP with Rho-GAP domain, ANK repeat and PH domain-containing protein 3-like isoform X2 [Entelurus aequoreus]|uniref:arf-GAP with Rho-GAP domain, ANK repeat and PH domain-containing protein 3-like isoform X2 n=1 Tax=Entelurus aequoreus TaxID=161455 RepID=UPI002B1DBC21|nr:arf-GAP with Rho-GAP domain, ANK repeat and PH domain-containing protein 3-like isoform X2 [Entelurus aequoreus]